MKINFKSSKIGAKRFAAAAVSLVMLAASAAVMPFAQLNVKAAIIDSSNVLYDDFEGTLSESQAKWETITANHLNYYNSAGAADPLVTRPAAGLGFASGTTDAQLKVRYLPVQPTVNGDFNIGKLDADVAAIKTSIADVKGTDEQDAGVIALADSYAPLSDNRGVMLPPYATQESQKNNSAFGINKQALMTTYNDAVWQEHQGQRIHEVETKFYLRNGVNRDNDIAIYAYQVDEQNSLRFVMHLDGVFDIRPNWVYPASDAAKPANGCKDTTFPSLPWWSYATTTGMNIEKWAVCKLTYNYDHYDDVNPYIAITAKFSIEVPDNAEGANLYIGADGKKYQLIGAKTINLELTNDNAVLSGTNTGKKLKKSDNFKVGIGSAHLTGGRDVTYFDYFKVNFRSDAAQELSSFDYDDFSDSARSAVLFETIKGFDDAAITNPIANPAEIDSFYFAGRSGILKSGYHGQPNGSGGAYLTTLKDGYLKENQTITSVETVFNASDIPQSNQHLGATFCALRLSAKDSVLIGFSRNATALSSRVYQSFDNGAGGIAYAWSNYTAPNTVDIEGWIKLKIEYRYDIDGYLTGFTATVVSVNAANEEVGTPWTICNVNLIIDENALAYNTSADVGLNNFGRFKANAAALAAAAENGSWKFGFGTSRQSNTQYLLYDSIKINYAHASQYTVSIPSGASRIEEPGVSLLGTISLTSNELNQGDQLVISAASGNDSLLAGQGSSFGCLIEKNVDLNDLPENMEGKFIPYMFTTDINGIIPFSNIVYTAADGELDTPFYASVDQSDWADADPGTYNDTLIFTVSLNP